MTTLKEFHRKSFSHPATYTYEVTPDPATPSATVVVEDVRGSFYSKLIPNLRTFRGDNVSEALKDLGDFLVMVGQELRDGTPLMNVPQHICLPETPHDG